MTTDERPAPRPRRRDAAPTKAKVAPPEGSIVDLYREILPAIDFDAEQTKWDVAITVSPSHLHTVLATGLRDERLSMNYLRNLTAVDWKDEGLEVVYHLFSMRHHHSVALKTKVAADGAHLPTCTDLYRAADWAEREAREMFGIEFDGHPDPRNLLLDEDLDIHPLLKKHPLAPIELKQGVDVEYFTKEHPYRPPARPTGEEAGDDDRAKRITDAKQRATAGGAEKKPAEELTPEELAEKKREQAERVQRSRELAAARRAEGPPGKTSAKAAARPAASAGAAPAAEAAPAAPAAHKAAPAPAAKSPAKAAADLTPEEAAERKAAQAERVRRSRELAAERRAQRKE